MAIRRGRRPIMKNIQKVALASLVAGTATAAGDANAAFDTFIKFDGIQGESTMKGEEGAIKISSFEFSGKSVADTSTTGLASGKRQLSEIVIQKPADAASISLFKSFLTGENLKGNVEIDFVTTSHNGTATPYLKYELTNVFITSYALSSGGDRPTESLSLNFQKIAAVFTGQVPGATVGAAPPSVSWDLAALKVE
jgi:type VI secretion system secreted protein Hcp